MHKDMARLDAEARQGQLAAQDRAKADEDKNYHFLQLDKRSMKAFRSLMSEHTKAAQLLIIFSERMNKENALVMSQTAMIELTGWSRPTISAAVKTLREGNWVQVLKIGTANAYIVNNNVFWQAERSKKHLHFRAAIIISESEQEKTFEQMSAVKMRNLPFAEIKEAQQKGAAVLLSNEKLDPPDQAEMDM
jgi:DNA-binding transcriptional regulator GbsR (MarR family)